MTTISLSITTSRSITETECDYIKNEVFDLLIPALEETLNKAKIWHALLRQKCFFNGIDHIVQVQPATNSHKLIGFRKSTFGSQVPYTRSLN